MKAASGFANMGLGWIEIPKNVINTSNEWNNVLFGMTGGLVKGTLHMLGRTVSGVVDLVTFPLPTQPIAQPPFVWQNFTMETQYGPIFKLQSQSRTPQAAMPPAKR
jgi:putative exosortase-associated protein (TIGR04073 family)